MLARPDQNGDAPGSQSTRRQWTRPPVFDDGADLLCVPLPRACLFPCESVGASASILGTGVPNATAVLAMGVTRRAACLDGSEGDGVRVF